MSRVLNVIEAGPGVSVQDLGRPGWIDQGLSRGGAMDRLALAEGAALLGQDDGLAVLEMAGFGGRFTATEDMRIALTGAPMRATIDGAPCAWQASHLLPAGAMLSVGGVLAGTYGYLHLGGGLALPEELGAQGRHRMAGIGAEVAPGAALPVGPDKGRDVGLTLPVEDRFAGGAVRIVPSVQTELFSEETRARFVETGFTRDARGNRMGLRLNAEGAGFGPDGALTLLSEIVVPGDIQITGDGSPFVLMAECQTTGGYPRIGTVIPPDLPRVAQASAGAELRFRFVTLEDGVAATLADRTARAGLRRACMPLVRDPQDIPDLLGYQLISGAVSATDP